MIVADRHRGGRSTIQTFDRPAAGDGIRPAERVLKMSFRVDPERRKHGGGKITRADSVEMRLGREAIRFSIDQSGCDSGSGQHDGLDAGPMLAPGRVASKPLFHCDQRSPAEFSHADDERLLE